MSELANSKAKRTAIRRSVTNYIKKIETIIGSDEVNLIELEECIELLKQKDSELKRLDGEIEKLIKDPKDLETEIDSVQEYLDKIHLWLFKGRKLLNKNQIKDLNISENKCVSAASDRVLDNIKLPKLSLPTFSGNITEWIAFKDLFNACVKNNSNLTNAQKMQYLKASLKGEAYRIIQSIQISDRNFEIAWDLVNERYSNVREQVFAYIKRFLSLPTIQTESTSAILNLVDNINEVVRSLEVLNQTIDNFGDTLMTYLILQKLDSSTKLWWERQLKPNEIPKLRELVEFLKNYARTLQNSKPAVNKLPKHVFQNRSNALIATSSCAFCKQDHNLAKCSNFLNLSVQQRIDFVKSNHLCFNCLSSMHLLKKCKSVNTCFYCSKKHHSILHIINNSKIKANSNNMSPNAQEFIPQKERSDDTKSSSLTVCASRYESIPNQTNHILLCTAVIKVQNSDQQFVKCRCLCDTGSQRSFITKECVDKLGLTVRDSSISVSCLGTFNTVCNGEVDLLFTSHFQSDLRISTSAFVMDKVTDNIPYASLPSSIFDNFSDLRLADPLFYKSQKIDILFGVNVFMHILTGEIIKRSQSLPFAISSRLGWIISGTTNLEAPISEPVFINHLNANTDELVSSFWELEKIPNVKPLTVEEKICEKHFESTHFREKTGRYSVALPFKPHRNVLGNSREMAYKRFLYLEKRLLSMPDVYNQYIKFMKEYFALGHMELVSDINFRTDNEHYYIPHHFVVNESSLTTKLRVVFDASAKTTTGVSLNDTLMVGPKTQDDLICILLRFRFYNIAITADIRMMYRQIQIHQENREFQRIFWRDSPNNQIQEFRLTTVTYGTAPAPYLATKVLNQLAFDEGPNFPKAKNVVLKDFYVDDVLTGVNNIQEGHLLIAELQQMLKKGGFELHKWSTNESSLLQFVDLNNTNSDNNHYIIDNKAIKVLGLEWHPEKDDFKCNYSGISYQAVPTKRIILSFVSRLFDPLGWIAPFVILTKIILQSLWKLQLSWDEPVPREIDQKWKILCEEVMVLNSIHVPRKVILPNYSQCSLHGFCDASEKGYAAVIYVKTCSGSNVNVKLLTSKTRVAPLKPITIPRLELCAAVLLAHLIQAVRAALLIEFDAVYAWTDSQIVLAWLNSDPKRWQVFVSNRVSEIQSILQADNWHHVDGKENPADCASRGLFPAELLSHGLWWNGPPWLKKSNVPMSKNVSINEAELPEARKTIISLISSETIEEPAIMQKISSYSRLQRIFAWILRFISNSKLKYQERNMSFLSSDEIRNATFCIVKIVQQVSFSKEIQRLKLGKDLPENSNLRNLCPFLDDHKVLRVGGRLKNAKLSENEKHPILLPSKHHVTKILIRHFHRKYLHAAPELLLSLIRQTFWIIAARSAIRQIVRSCVTCCRHRAHTASQIMADLPGSRVIQSRPFHRTGLDFAGPFMIKYRSGRGQKSFKSYVCVFVCFVVKAVHLEVVEDLSTKAFLSALKRFVARRGKPLEIYSDCATNFKGAEKEINKFAVQCKQNPDLHEYLSAEEIKWIFNPPSSPHFGGLWESTVKSMKYHLKRTAGDSVLTYPEFQTLILQIEACLNSRPLCPNSSDPSDLTALTPGHFLVGTSLTAIPEEQSHPPMNHLDRWHVRQFIFQQFWKRWSREYLTQLQQRPKWQKSQQNLKINDLVLIKDDNLPPLKWKLGRIIAVHPGSDNKVRVVTIKTTNGDMRRPIVKLCPLHLEN